MSETDFQRWWIWTTVTLLSQCLVEISPLIRKSCLLIKLLQSGEHLGRAPTGHWEKKRKKRWYTNPWREFSVHLRGVFGFPKMCPLSWNSCNSCPKFLSFLMFIHALDCYWQHSPGHTQTVLVAPVSITQKQYALFLYLCTHWKNRTTLRSSFPGKAMFNEDFKNGSCSAKAQTCLSSVADKGTEKRPGFYPVQTAWQPFRFPPL